MPKIVATTLFLYELPRRNFFCADKNAGYFVSRRTETPIQKVVLTELRRRIEHLGAELRLVPDLSHFGSRVAASSLSFSLIRMRNAIPPAYAA